MTTTPARRGPGSRRRVAAVGALAASTLLLAACGDGMGGMDHGDSAGSSASAEDSRPAAFNDTDVNFAQSMIEHHEQAVEMARLAGTRASDREIRDRAEQIERAREPEIETMTTLLETWGKPTGMEGMDHSGMDGTTSRADMKRLETTRDAAFDRAFAQMMIEHHEGAIAMAEDEQANGENSAAKRLAGTIVEDQNAEIDRLGAILDRL